MLDFVFGLIPKILDLVGQFQAGRITQAQLEAQLKTVMVQSAADVEKTRIQASAQTFEAFTQASVTSRLMRIVWAIVVLTQLLVVMWAQVGIPFVSWYFGIVWPSAGTTIDWAYALLGFCLGAGPIVLSTKLQFPKV